MKRCNPCLILKKSDSIGENTQPTYKGDVKPRVQLVRQKIFASLCIHFVRVARVDSFNLYTAKNLNTPISIAP